MTDFDPDKHKIVAVVVEDGPEKGQHFHLSLPDLAREVHETTIVKEVGPSDDVIKALSDRVFSLETRKPSREVVTTQVETLPQEYVDQIERITRDLKTFKESQEFVLPRAFAELVDRVQAIESRPVDITPATSITAVVEERLAGHDTRLEALEGQGDASADLYEAMAKLMRQLAGMMRAIESNKARSDSQYEVLMDHMGQLAATIRRAG